MKNYLPLIIGMASVTYLPRLIPLVALNDRKTNNNVRQFLQYIPYTSLGILITRGIMTADSNMKTATIAGVGIAGILSYKKGNLVLSVLAGILLSFVIINFKIRY